MQAVTNWAVRKRVAEAVLAKPETAPQQLDGATGATLIDFRTWARQEHSGDYVAAAKAALREYERLYPKQPKPKAKELTVEQEYISLSLPDTKALLVRSAMGTGKSTALEKIIEQHTGSLLIITHRKSLGRSMAKRYGTAYYEDFENNLEELQKQSRLVICLDSIWKLETTRHFELVILDEVEQVLAHAMGETIRKKRRTAEVIEWLRHFITRANRVLMLDADLGELTRNYAERYLGAENITAITNTYKALCKKVVLYNVQADAQSNLMERAGAGEKLYVATNSKDKALALSRMLQEAYPELKIMTITSDNSCSEEGQDFILHINERIEEYDVVIASPSIGTGISIDNKYFDRVFLFGEAGITTHFDLWQQAMRVRHTYRQELHVWISPKAEQAEVSPLSLEAKCLAQWRETGLQVGIAPDNTLYSKDDDYVWLWARVRAMQNNSMNDLQANFIRLAERRGHTVVQGKRFAEKEQRATRKQYSRSLKANKQQFAEQVRTVEPLRDYLAYAELKEATHKTEEQRAQCYQWELVDWYGILPEQITGELVEADRKGLRAKVREFSLLLCPEEVAKELDRRELRVDTNGPARSRVELSHNYLKRKLRLQLLERVGITDIAAEQPVIFSKHKFVEWVQLRERELESVLGIKLRSNFYTVPILLISDVLKQMGLRLTLQIKTNKGGSRTRIYTVNTDALRSMQQLAARYTERLQKLEEDWKVEAPAR